MAKVRQYFAPIDKLDPDREGWTAMERSARAVSELYQQVAHDYQSAGKVKADVIDKLGWPFDIYKIEAEGAKNFGAFEPRGGRGGGGGGGHNPEAYKQWLNATAQAETTPTSGASAGYGSELDTHMQVSHGAAALGRMAALYGNGYRPTMPRTGELIDVGAGETGSGGKMVSPGDDPSAWYKSYNQWRAQNGLPPATLSEAEKAENAPNTYVPPYASDQFWGGTGMGKVKDPNTGQSSKQVVQEYAPMLPGASTSQGPFGQNVAQNSPWMDTTSLDQNLATEQQQQQSSPGFISQAESAMSGIISGISNFVSNLTGSSTPAQTSADQTAAPSAEPEFDPTDSGLN